MTWSWHTHHHILPERHTIHNTMGSDFKCNLRSAKASCTCIILYKASFDGVNETHTIYYWAYSHMVPYYILRDRTARAKNVARIENNNDRRCDIRVWKWLLSNGRHIIERHTSCFMCLKKVRRPRLPSKYPHQQVVKLHLFKNDGLFRSSFCAESINESHILSDRNQELLWVGCECDYTNPSKSERARLETLREMLLKPKDRHEHSKVDRERE
jgi:hypothetical protein